MTDVARIVVAEVAGMLAGLWAIFAAFHFFDMPTDAWYFIPTVMTVLLACCGLAAGIGFGLYRATAGKEVKS